MNRRTGRYSPSTRTLSATQSARVGRCSQGDANSAYVLVPKGGLEPPRPKPLPPQGSASTNSATSAMHFIETGFIAAGFISASEPAAPLYQRVSFFLYLCHLPQHRFPHTPDLPEQLGKAAC